MKRFYKVFIIFRLLLSGPQSPCERTDLRMAIVADHLGLSWTEMAREMEFSVDEINQIRVENPNSLTAQSFMLLKKWVSRDGKNATTDALSAVLTKINRLDIVTLLEGPIFDYGNISGTRCFADDSAVSQEQADGLQGETSGAKATVTSSARGPGTDTQGQRESSQQPLPTTAGVQGEKQNGEHPEHHELLSKGKAEKESGWEEVSSEVLEDRGTGSINEKDGVPFSEVQAGERANGKKKEERQREKKCQS